MEQKKLKTFGFVGIEKWEYYIEAKTEAEAIAKLDEDFPKHRESIIEFAIESKIE